MKVRLDTLSVAVGLCGGAAAAIAAPHAFAAAADFLRSHAVPPANVAVAVALAAAAALSLSGMLRRAPEPIRLRTPEKVGEPAVRPIEWMAKHGVTLKDSVLDRFACMAAFAEQLGDRYLDSSRLPPYALALAVVFMLARRRDKRTQDLKERLADIWAGGASDDADRLTMEALTPIMESDRNIRRTIDREASGHAYVNTALIGLFEWAKGISSGMHKDGGGSGILPCGEFLWLKPVDRVLWYGLMNTGRHAYFIEGAGSRAHYLAERAVRRPLSGPHVEGAVDGLADYIIDQGLLDGDAPPEPQPEPVA